MGAHSPKMLTTTMIYVTMRMFGMRGSDELNRFNLGNVKIEEIDDDYCQVQYIEACSKNRQPGLKNINKEKKDVKHYERKTNQRGFIYWLNVYLSHCPESLKKGVFWLHPVNNWEKKSIWYTEKKKIGVNHFNTLVKSMYNEANLVGDFMLRSIRASLVNDLTQMNFDSPVIRTRTGQKTDAACNKYMRPKEIEIQKQLSDILNHDTSRKWNRKTIKCMLMNCLQSQCIIYLIFGFVFGLLVSYVCG